MHSSFSTGRCMLAKDGMLRALPHFERAYLDEPTRAEHQSYYGAAIGLERGQMQRSVELCAEALQAQPARPDFRLNLARVCLKVGDKGRAIEVLERGLQLHPDHGELQAMRDQLGYRQPPVIPFLSRGNFLNRLLGAFRARWLGQRTPRALPPPPVQPEPTLRLARN